MNPSSNELSNYLNLKYDFPKNSLTALSKLYREGSFTEFNRVLLKPPYAVQICSQRPTSDVLQGLREALINLDCDNAPKNKFILALEGVARVTKRNEALHPDQAEYFFNSDQFANFAKREKQFGATIEAYHDVLKNYRASNMLSVQTGTNEWFCYKNPQELANELIDLFALEMQLSRKPATAGREN